MKIVKISQPSGWANKINQSTPEEKGIWKNYKFVLTNDTIDCDYWIVLGDIDVKQQANCAPENIFFITDEAYPEKKYNQNFLNQFASVITSRDDITHSNIIKSPYICGWYIKKNYDFLNALNPSEINKSKIISVVSSDLNYLEGHIKRYAFVNKMMGHFKNRLDVYGRGINPIDDKYDALINYKYSIAIENSHLHGYFSDKIIDCLLTYTMPIYYGCTNILEYFPEEAMIKIDINNYIESIEIIEEAIRTNRFEKNFDNLVEARKIYLNTYHPLQAMSNILDRQDPLQHKKGLQSLQSMNFFNNQKQTVPLLKRVYRKIKNI